MGKRKAKNSTLTKIDPSILKPKMVAVSQYAAHGGARVTTAVNPIRAPPVSSIDPFAFDFGFDSHVENEEEDEEDEDEQGEDDVSKKYYVARVCVF